MTNTLTDTPANIQRTGECVLNLPSVDEVAAANRLARTTGSDPVPAWKAEGRRFAQDDCAAGRPCRHPSFMRARCSHATARCVESTNSNGIT